MIDLKAINLRLGNKRFLNGPAEESFFSHLTMAIQGLARPGDEGLKVPEYNEADAWARAYALYTALQLRQPDPAAVKGEEDGRIAAAISRRMNQCADDTEALKAFRDRNRTSWSTLCEYIGFDEQDLNSPPVDPRFGVAEGWAERGSRIAGALARLQGISESERRDAPAKVEQRRLRRHLEETERRLTALEQKVAAIESRLPQAEIRETADAA